VDEADKGLVVRASLAERSGRWTGWDWRAHPGGVALDGVGEQADWGSWHDDRYKELRFDGASAEDAAAQAAAEGRYGMAVQASAEAAEEAGAACAAAASCGEWGLALHFADEARSAEEEWGDATVWGPFRDLVADLAEGSE